MTRVRRRRPVGHDGTEASTVGQAAPPEEPKEEPVEKDGTEASTGGQAAGEVDKRPKYRAVSEIFAGQHRHCDVGSVIPADWPESIIESLLSQNAIEVIE